MRFDCLAYFFGCVLPNLDEVLVLFVLGLQTSAVSFLGCFDLQKGFLDDIGFLWRNLNIATASVEPLWVHKRKPISLMLTAASVVLSSLRIS
jgi:hypothetical protein